ncbi:adenosine kinase [Marinoscillum sp. MHG1-6]|uniref:adenosine kinase n=1 Tax=Marinoscillum sp. MHG1-6 TaxID=2959627 RepID=UPI0021589EF6|nr:adenosine kinase [Marinoscillum sp. MHG1-6]
MDKKYHVYGLGNAVVDYEIEVSESFFEENDVEKGLMTLVEQEKQMGLLKVVKNNIKKKQSGGSAANSIISLAQMGGKAFYSCKVASDEDGSFYVDGLTEAGVKTNLVKDQLADGVTGKCLVMVSPDAERTMYTFLGATSDFSERELVPDAIAESKYLFIEGYLVPSESGRSAIKEAKRIAKENGVKVSLSFSDPAMVKYFKNQMQEVVGDGVDLLFCNEEEAMLFTDTVSVIEAREALREYADKFVITMGKNGACVFDGDTFIDIESYPVKAVDTTGAGDMFCGAFLYGVTHGHTMASSAKLASKASSVVVSQFGPRLEAVQTLAVLKEVFG